MYRSLSRFIGVTIGLFLGSLLWAYPFPSNVEWRYYDTPHFNIYYTPETRYAAKKAVAMVEDIFSQITRELHYTPPDKIELILVDQMDMVNGYADYLRHTVVIEISPIQSADLGPFHQQALHNLITHEVTHILQMGINYSSSLVYSLIKRLSSKGFLYPYFVIEGYAIANENSISQGGRLYNAYYYEQIIAFARADNFPELSQISNADTLRWPMGNGPYVVGAMFVDYLDKRFGRDKLIKAFHLFSQEFYLDSFDAAFYKAYERQLPVVYKEFTDHYRMVWMNLHDRESSMNVLIEPDAYQSRVQWTSSGDIAYYRYDTKQAPQIRIHDPDTGADRQLFQHPYMTGQFALQDGVLLYTAYDRPNIDRTDTLLKRRVLKTGQEKRLFDHVAQFETDDQYILVVQDDITKNRLFLMSKATGQIDPLFTTSTIETCAIRYPRIAYVSRTESRSAVEVYNIRTKEQKMISTFNIRDVVFVNDHTLGYVRDYATFGQFFTYDLDTGIEQRHTHVFTGVFSPAIRDETLMFTTLTDRGYAVVDIDDIFNRQLTSPPDVMLPHQGVVTPDRQAQTPTETVKRATTNWIERYKKPKTEGPVSRPYNIFALNSMFVVPFLSISNYGNVVGISAMLSDPLQFQQLYINYLDYYGSDAYEFQYTNTWLNPFLSISKAKEYGDEYLDAYFIIPWYMSNVQHQVNAGLSQTVQSGVNYEHYKITHVMADAFQYPHSVSPENGYSNQLTLKSNSVTGQKTVYDTLKLFLPGVDLNHVIALNMTIGNSEDHHFIVAGYPASFYVRGYPITDKLKGPNVFRFSGEYRFPFTVVDQMMLMGYYVYHIAGVWFYDIADTPYDMSLSSQQLRSYGFLLESQGLQFNTVPLNIGIGIAHTTKKNTVIFFTLGTTLF